MLLLWLALFKAETKEELDRIKSLEVSIMEQAINAYNTITVSPEFQELERLRSLARYNEASALRYEREQAIAEERKEIVELLKSGKPLADIIKELETD